jgi:tetratricopeptide (TPR) repeat protein
MADGKPRVFISAVPAPATAKPVVLPYPSIGPLFKGRGGFMQQLHESLARHDGTAVSSKALYGLGGIGKTRAAVEYAWAHENEYTALLFVLAASPEALRANLAALSRTLAPDLDTVEDDVRLHAVQDWLGTHPGWLLILDNVDSAAALAAVEDLMRQLRGGRVVVTSRRSDFTANIAPLALDVLPLTDAAAFLLERTDERRRPAVDDDAKAREIASELDGLPIALEQAGACIAKRRLTFDRYLQQWRSSYRDKGLDWFNATLAGYPRAVAVTWQTSVAQLTEPGRRLLERLAFLASEKVPEFLLDVPIPGAEAEDLHGALEDLATYSLVTRDEGRYFLVHRLVQDVTRRSLADERSDERLTETLRWIDAAFPGEASDAGSWPRAEPLAPHARAVIAAGERAAISDPTAWLMNRLGMLLHAKALYAEAEPFYQRSLAIREKALGNAHAQVATSLNNIAELYRVQGRYAKAEPLYRQALAIREKAVGVTHPDVGVLLDNLALLYIAQGRYAEAEPLFHRSLAIREQALGTDHPDVGTTLDNLAGLYQSQGRDAEAEPLFQRSLAIRGEALGNDHPSVATALNNLAEFYRAQGRRAEPEPLYRRSIAIFRAISRQIGRPHPSLETAVGNYAIFLAAVGKSEAEINAERERLMRWQE